MQFCDYEPFGNEYRCRCCGDVKPHPHIRNCQSQCLGKPPEQEEPPPLLGDRTEALLKKIGVTPERYAEVREMFGGAPATSGCGCGARKRAMNEWHRKVRAWWQGQG